MGRMTSAERLLVGLGIAEPKDIDLDAIAWTQGAVVNYRPIDNCEATILGSKKRAVISVNSLSMRQRRRFSLGHELGHWHYDRGKVLFCGKNDVCNFRHDALSPERRADDFASDLILPNFMVLPRLRKMKRLTLAASRELADEFDVSLTTTLVKMIALNHFPMVIVCHNRRDRVWYKTSPMIAEWWRPVRALDDQTFAADMLLRGADEQNFPRKNPADAWFDFKGCDRYEVEEQSFLLPDDEILTVLTLPRQAIA
ncbi:MULTISPECIES: ImmA/IrrE family metallo-endopeptidase [unclassified Bradyrhizobium]|uniref:ImmA/IrrE family metallo-endopeptidase n=2 Tax=unclassified Bradyrhizobium TaxID=2631580 RepID=UPI00339AB35D